MSEIPDAVADDLSSSHRVTFVDEEDIVESPSANNRSANPRTSSHSVLSIIAKAPRYLLRIQEGELTLINPDGSLARTDDFMGDFDDAKFLCSIARPCLQHLFDGRDVWIAEIEQSLLTTTRTIHSWTEEFVENGWIGVYLQICKVVAKTVSQTADYDRWLASFKEKSAQNTKEVLTSAPFKVAHWYERWATSATYTSNDDFSILSSVQYAVDSLQTIVDADAVGLVGAWNVKALSLWVEHLQPRLIQQHRFVRGPHNIEETVKEVGEHFLTQGENELSDWQECVYREGVYLKLFAYYAELRSDKFEDMTLRCQILKTVSLPGDSLELVIPAIVALSLNQNINSTVCSSSASSSSSANSSSASYSYLEFDKDTFPVLMAGLETGLDFWPLWRNLPEKTKFVEFVLEPCLIQQLENRDISDCVNLFQKPSAWTAFCTTASTQTWIELYERILYYAIVGSDIEIKVGVDSIALLKSICSSQDFAFGRLVPKVMVMCSTSVPTRASLEALICKFNVSIGATSPVSHSYLRSALYDSAFQNIYQSSSLTPVDALRMHIYAGIEQCKSCRIYSPSVPVVQGTGTGKTKIAGGEMSRHFFTCHLNLGNNTLGYPLKSPLADLFLGLHHLGKFVTDETAIQRNFYNFFFALIQSFERLAGKLQGHTSVEQRRKHFATLVSIDETSSQQFADDVGQAYDMLATQSTTITKEDIRLALQNALAALNKTGDPPSTFLIVLDESRAMLNSEGSISHFKQWRKAIHDIMCCDQWFFLLLETSSTVTNFYPYPKVVNESRRHGSNRLLTLTLLPPFHSLAFTGPWDVPGLHEKGEYTAPGSNFFRALKGNAGLELLRWSRPMFFVSAGDNNLMQAVQLAINKIYGSPEEIKNSNKNELLRPMLCYSYGMKPLTEEIKEKLIRDRCGTLLSFQADRPTIMAVGYIPEPMLGEACARVLDDTMFATVVSLLKTELEQEQLGMAHSKGDQGEFSSIVYSLEIMKRSRQHTGIILNRDAKQLKLRSVPVCIYSYLSTMIGGTTPDVEALVKFGGSDTQRYVWRHCLHALVNFTGFSQACGSLNSSGLKASINSHICWRSKAGETGIDMWMGAVLRTDAQSQDRIAASFHQELRLRQLQHQFILAANASKKAQEKADKADKADKEGRVNKKQALLQANDNQPTKKQKPDEPLEKLSNNAGDSSTTQPPNYPRPQQYVLGDVVVVFQVKNEDDLSSDSLNDKLKVVRKASRYALEQTGCSFCIVILHLVGGKDFRFIDETVSMESRRVMILSPSLPNADIVNPSTAEFEYGDIDLCSLYIAVSGFPGLLEKERDALDKLSLPLSQYAITQKSYESLLGEEYAKSKEGLEKYFSETLSLQNKMVPDTVPIRSEKMYFEPTADLTWASAEPTTFKGLIVFCKENTSR